ncbi:uncharacterized protein LOC134312169 [Trichomycterus rosablanca]|uniref:uncharacterized protein LOC134312169 n=1 Tax=Trichomycterus rosablanca TaxID=2290929 RepID=UPI002F350C3D
MDYLRVRSRWAGRACGSTHFYTTQNIKWILSPSQEDRVLMPTIPVPTQGISLQADTDKDLLIFMLVQQIEYLYLSNRQSAKKALTVRSSTVSLAHEATTHSSVPHFTKVLRHHYKNQLRMLAHRWKRLGLQHPASANRSDQASGQSEEKSQNGIKTKSFINISPIQNSKTAAPKDNQEPNKTKAADCLSSNRSDTEKFTVSDRHSPKIRPALSECYSDSDLSDQEKESIDTSNMTMNMELDLKPEPFDKYLDESYSPELPEVYSDVLPSPLEALDFTQLLSSQLASEFQQSLDLIDPCLGPIIQRLVELEKLQAATVQKEREKPARSRPNAVYTPNANRVKKCDVSGSKIKNPGCKITECNTVTCTFTKLTLCPNSSRHQTCSSSKPGQASRTVWPHSILPKRPHTMSGKLKRPDTSVNVSAKLTMPNRIRKPKPHRVDATSDKTATPRRKEPSTKA